MEVEALSKGKGIIDQRRKYQTKAQEAGTEHLLIALIKEPTVLYTPVKYAGRTYRRYISIC